MATLALALALVVGGCGSSATKGTMPPPGAGGEIDPSSAPDYIAITGREGGVVGYGRKADVLGDLDRLMFYPVYAEDLRTLVGWMVTNQGFVSINEQPMGPSIAPVPAAEGSGATPPPVQASDMVAIYLRDGSLETAAHLAVREGVSTFVASSSYPPATSGAGCMPIPNGAHLDLLDRDPGQQNAIVIAQLFVRGLAPAPAPASIWIDIAADGAITQGTGKPAWWDEDVRC